MNRPDGQRDHMFPWVVATGLVGAAVATAALFVPRGFAAPAASSQPSSQNASASAHLGAKGTPLPVDLGSIGLPVSKSGLPKPDEWKGATLARPSRGSPATRTCKVEVLREYAKVSCPSATGAVRQFVGDIEDVETWVAPHPKEDFWVPPTGAYVVFPLRKGHGFVFQFFTVDSGYSGVGLDDGMIVDAYWAPSDPAPTINLRKPAP